MLRAVETDELVTAFGVLLEYEVSADVTDVALSHLAELFAAGQQSLGASMAGRAEEGVGEPETVSRTASILAADLVGRMGAGA